MSSAVKLVLITALALTAGCTTIHQMDSSKMKVVSLPDGMTEDVVNQIRAGEAVVFKIPKGQSIPVKVSVNLPFMNLENGTNNASFAQDMFLTVNSAGLRISPDAQRWADINDLESIKALFGVDKGSIALGLHATLTEGTYLSLKISDEK